MKVFESRFLKEELNLVNEVLQKGQLGFGPNVLEFENEFKSFSKKEHNIATNSASAAIFMIFAYLREKYGTCNIYTPSLAFTSPAWAAQHFEHNIIWIDINDNLLFDCEDYLNVRNEEYQPVVMPILYGGVSNIDGWDLKGDEIVVVDSAHCATPTIKSDFTFFSFHPYKPICTSDGGMISTDDLDATEYFRNYRNFGRQNTENSYDIIQEGFKFYMNNLNATLGLISLKKYYEDLEIRKNNYAKLEDVLPHDEKSSYYFATKISDDADDFNRKNQLDRHYPLLHKSKFFKGEDNIILPNTELLYNNIINLPLWKLL
jgi:dTDP-4-amino-4,6-dideoxygalactose transaminase